MLRSARNQIECAFGRLNARWAILTRRLDLRLEIVPTVVYACFVLHNICESKNIHLDEDDVQSQIERHQVEEQTIQMYLIQFIHAKMVKEN